MTRMCCACDGTGSIIYAARPGTPGAGDLPDCDDGPCPICQGKGVVERSATLLTLEEALEVDAEKLAILQNDICKVCGKPFNPYRTCGFGGCPNGGDF